MRNIKILLFSISLILFLLSLFFIENNTLFISMVILAVLVFVLPIMIINFIEFRKIRAYEKFFPNFLRDLAESQQSDINLIDAIKIASKSNYGLLTKEIKKLNNQLSWNVPLSVALEKFRNRLKASKVISRSVIVMEEACRSGGNTKEILKRLSENIEEINELNTERTTLMKQQVSMIYVIYFIFIGIVIALIKFLIPMLGAESGGAGISSLSLFGSANANPCQLCTPGNLGCAVCGIYSFITKVAGFGSFVSVASYYKSLFFAMIIIQGILSGLISGQIGADSLSAGIKHIIVLTFSGGIIFLIVNWLGLI